jgi:SAM-dependent methyltransferase
MVQAALTAVREEIDGLVTPPRRRHEWESLLITDWLAFWDSPHSIYVSARHKDVHYQLIAKKIAALVPAADARVLDYGCGEALHADLVAAVVGELYLYEAAPGIRAGLTRRFADNPKIHVLMPHGIARMPEHSLDLIVLISVVQYLTAAGASALFLLFHRLLKRGGVLIVSDVIPLEATTATDEVALPRFGYTNRFFLAAILGPHPHLALKLSAAALAARTYALH